MNIYEIEKYAQDNDFDGLKFIMRTKDGREFEGQFLDAFFGMILVPELGEGFIRLNTLINAYGFDYLTFTPID